jgi:hypothetical protein
VEELGGSRDGSTHNCRTAHSLLPHLPHVHCHIHKERTVPYMHLSYQRERGGGRKSKRRVSSKISNTADNRFGGE